MKVNQNEKFATKLKMLRLEKGKTQEEFSQELGITRGCLANYETGQRTPDGEMLKRLAELLDVSIDFLMSRSDIRKISLNEEELKIYTKANEKLKEYGDIINLNDIGIVSRIQLLEYFQYLKEQEAKEKERLKRKF